VRQLADFLHLLGPLLIVVALARGSAVFLLPYMHHLMHKRRENVFVVPALEHIGIQRQLVSVFLVAAVAEAICGEVTARRCKVMRTGESLPPKRRLLKKCVSIPSS
jgi:hypothetical protein